jgi:transcription antitermination factor NusG
MEIKTWHVVTTRPGKEAQAFGELGQYSMLAFMPTFQESVFNHAIRKMVIRRSPVISGYVFAAARRAFDWRALHGSKFITGILSRDGKPFAMPDAEFAAMADADGRGLFEQDFGKKNSLLREGDIVEVIDRELASHAHYCGKVVSVKGKRVVLDMLNRLDLLSVIDIRVDQVKKVG